MKSKSLFEYSNTILVEYNHETGGFHYNLYNERDGFFDKPYTNGWEPICHTFLKLADAFTDTVQAENRKRKRINKNTAYLTTEYIKWQWRLFVNASYQLGVFDEISDFNPGPIAEQNDISRYPETLNEDAYTTIDRTDDKSVYSTAIDYNPLSIYDSHHANMEYF